MKKSLISLCFSLSVCVFFSEKSFSSEKILEIGDDVIYKGRKWVIIDSKATDQLEEGLNALMLTAKTCVKTEEQMIDSLRRTSIQDLFSHTPVQVKEWIFGMNRYAHNDLIRNVLNSEANRVSNHEFFDTERFDTDEEQMRIDDESLLENWQRWYTYKTLAVKFGDLDAKIALDQAIMSKQESVENIYFSVENPKLGKKAEDFYLKEIEFITGR